MNRCSQNRSTHTKQQPPQNTSHEPRKRRLSVTRTAYLLHSPTQLLFRSKLFCGISGCTHSPHRVGPMQRLRNRLAQEKANEVEQAATHTYNSAGSEKMRHDEHQQTSETNAKHQKGVRVRWERQKLRSQRTGRKERKKERAQEIVVDPLTSRYVQDHIGRANIVGERHRYGDGGKDRGWSAGQSAGRRIE